MSQPTPLTRRTAIATGASSRIGHALAEHLGEAGAHTPHAGRTQPTHVNVSGTVVRPPKQLAL
jgi:NAD(P)-dependent dehydrogenase (short-subunit alcohol dehydrogenase family)